MDREKAFSLFAQTPEQIAQVLGLEKSFQGKQIYQWLVRGASSFDEMTNLSKALRQELSEKYPSVFSSTVAAEQTDDDGKLGHSGNDGDCVYCWVHSRKSANGKTLVSSQTLLDANSILASYQGDAAYTLASSSYGQSISAFLSPDGDATGSTDDGGSTPSGGGDEGGGGL